MSSNSETKIIYLTAGAGGMFCGSCMHDNALSRALSAEGWNIQLVPTYTPIRTDESDFSVDKVLFGGINVYLQQKIPFLRYLPSVFDRFLDSPWLIRKVTSRAMETDGAMLGSLAYSMLLGSRGNQRKEVRKICRWMSLARPDVLIFSNILIGGCIEDIKQVVDCPVLVTLQGDDVFLDSLKPPYRSQCINRVKEIANKVDGFIVQSHFFKKYMCDYFSLDPLKVHVTPLGLEVADYNSFLSRAEDEPVRRTQTVGYLARIAPEKGLHHLVEAFIKLKAMPGTEDARLHVAGWLSPENQAYADEQWGRLDHCGLQGSYQYEGAVDREAKLEFFRNIDLLSVPTSFQEPKGLYALEAMAAGVPVVLPSHGAFPELLEASGGGLLFEPENETELAKTLSELLLDGERRLKLGGLGQRFIHQHRNASVMAESTSEIIKKFLV
ncbi:MAG: glycosyltransferase family 4 protein [Mariniblastus sp.]|nr:glycosyltransferase family 4 protein [Mariniblastus sp.]MDG2180064.1 glycosyltransferase family 4 protein [Mariniblastus sp.]